MEKTILSAAEAVEYGEFKRSRREAEIQLTLKKLMVDASRRETDKTALRRACETAQKLKSCGVLVSPVNVSSARRQLSGSETQIVCLVGGTGESLPSVKKTETKKALRQGAKEVRLVLCYSALTGGNLQYLKKEIRKVKRAAKRYALTVSLEDHALGEAEVGLGVRAACGAGADGVCVRGEIPLVLRAVQAAAGRVRIDVSGVENSEQLRALIKAGALRATTRCAEQLSEELHRSADEQSIVQSSPFPSANPQSQDN